MVGAANGLFFVLWARWSGRRGHLFASSSPMIGAVLPNGRGGVLFFMRPRPRRSAVASTCPMERAWPERLTCRLVGLPSK